jgi:hypothetical protein
VKSKWNFLQGLGFLFAVTLLSIALILWLKERKDSPLAVQPAVSPAVVAQIDEHSVLGSRLFTRNSAEGRSRSFNGMVDATLWIQNANQSERCVASNVIQASFSPDGRKIVYASAAGEIVIETLEGKCLARLARARDPLWRSDSAAVTFSATASADYRDFQQTICYDLATGQTRLLSQGE